ncbi:MAG: response regulator [Anaerolineales bacterium]
MVPRLLAVDDDPLLTERVALWLEPLGWQVQGVLNGRTALSQAEQMPPDAVLLDVNLGGMNGYAVCEALRRQPALAHIPILIITGDDGDAAISRAFEAGATDYIRKPFRQIELVQRLSRHYDAYLAHRQSRRYAQIMEAVSYTTGELLRYSDWQASLAETLPGLAQAVEAARASVLRVGYSGTGPYLAPLDSWQIPELPTLGAIIIDLNTTPGLEDWAALLQAKQIVHRAEEDNGAGAFFAARGTHTWLGLPVHSGTQWWGVLLFERRQTDPPWAPIEINALATAADLMGATRYRHHIAAMEERQRIARDLHDSVTQTIFSARMVAETLPRLWDHAPGDVPPLLDELRLLMHGALGEMRTLLFELRPETLQQESLGQLIEQLVASRLGNLKIAYTLHVADDLSLPLDVKIVFYRVLQEALNNIIKYAHATQVRVAWYQGPGATICLDVQDDGAGFETGHVPEGRYGLRIMRERAASIHARLDVTSVPGAGTVIRLRWEPGQVASQ